MSHYAQIVKKLVVACDLQPAGFTLVAGTQIKSVKLDDGGYTFKAYVGGGQWWTCTTAEDLPAFTDKGRAHRERDVPATLKPGRPIGGGAATVKPIAFRPTTEQRAWLQKHADKKGVTLSELVRVGLFKLGMPR